MVAASVVGGGRLSEWLAHPLCVGADELRDEGEDGGVRVAVELGEEADGEGLEESALHVAGAGEGAPRRRGRDLERAAKRPQGEGGRVTCGDQNLLYLRQPWANFMTKALHVYMCTWRSWLVVGLQLNKL